MFLETSTNKPNSVKEKYGLILAILVTWYTLDKLTPDDRHQPLHSPEQKRVKKMGGL